MRFAFKKSHSQVAYCALSIRSGTADEPQKYSGLAHLTEHMLFKGTDKRNATNINNRLEVLGGELNAYTTKEETVVHATVLKEDISKAIDLLFEIVFRSTFLAKELEKEKAVVIDEINLYKDSPSDYIFDDFEQFLFDSHPLSRPILGTVSSLKRIQSEAIVKYVSQNFTPDRMSFAIVGDFDKEAILKTTAKILKKYTDNPLTDDNQPIAGSTAAEPVFKPFNKTVAKHNHQANCIIGCTGYSLYDERRIALILLINILGGPSSNSKLNSTLREKKALVYAVEASYTQYSQTGAVTIYFGCDKNNVEKCKDLVLGELKKVKENPMSESALKTAKKQMLAQLAVSSENGEVQALAIGKSVLVFGNYLSDEQVRAKINAITAQDLITVANDIFADEKLSYLFYI
ncbi:MAG: insulinase family protein [Bacteroidales bacterium]|nr:insulinase family protein [Bacteroidales bacterium]